MRTYSNQKPEGAYKIIKCGDAAEVIFYENVTQEEEGYSFDEARVCVPYRDNLAENIEKNTEAWRRMAHQPQDNPLSEREEIQRLKDENALMGEALTQLILEVM